MTNSVETSSRDTAILMMLGGSAERPLAHLRRLRAECGKDFDVYWVRHTRGAGDLPEGPTADIDLRDDDLKAALPSRYREFEDTQGAIAGPFLDLVHFAAAQRVIGKHRYIWFVEYDVDYAGNWASFFRAMTESEADLLGTHLRPFLRSLRWPNWRSFRHPNAFRISSSISGFFPVVRMSNAFVRTYTDKVSQGWKGHFEALYGSLARYEGLQIEDIGWEGPFTPQHRARRFYIGNSGAPVANAANGVTFAWRPNMSDQYYFESSANFRHAGMLYHPVKVEGGL